MRRWEKLPQEMQTEEVRKYYDILKKKKAARFFKRLFDIVFSLLLLIASCWLFVIIAVVIKIDSRGPVFFRQERVTRYGKKFRIFKFRTMVADAEKRGTQITLQNDSRITRIGRLLRNSRLDEIPQLIDILRGTMTFVGTRPEVPKYVAEYTPAMRATLLMPAGVTSLASIYYKDEAELLENAADSHEVYKNKILPEKMYYNLRGLEKFSFFGDLGIMMKTVFAVLGKEYVDDRDKGGEK